MLMGVARIPQPAADRAVMHVQACLHRLLRLERTDLDPEEHGSCLHKAVVREAHESSARTTRDRHT